MSVTQVDPDLDLSDPDLLADHLPLGEFAWLRRNEPIRWNARFGTAFVDAATARSKLRTNNQSWRLLPFSSAPTAAGRRSESVHAAQTHSFSPRTGRRSG